MRTKLYDIKKTNAYKSAEGIYTILPENYKFRIAELVSKEIYAALLFNFNVVRRIEGYCGRFFDCDEHGLSYELGCYFQKKEYKTRENIVSDLKKFTSLESVYDSSRFPKEFELIHELVIDLLWFIEKWNSFEKSHPELFIV